MALTIEDGSGVSDADSFATVAQARAWATSRGFTSLPADDADVEVLLREACDYLQSLESRYKGSRTSDEQVLAWPRSDVYLFSPLTLFPDDEIPQQLINAQCQLACDAVANDLLPLGAGREVVREKVDVIETEYAKSGTGTIQPEFNRAMALLAPCLQGGSFGVTTVRV